jgi:hypothetical protein
MEFMEGGTLKQACKHDFTEEQIGAHTCNSHCTRNKSQLNLPERFATTMNQRTWPTRCFRASSTCTPYASCIVISRART